MERIPPMDGAVLLGSRGRGPVPKTYREVHFRSCQIGFVVTEWDADGKAIGFSLIILDPQENTKYVFLFGEDLRISMLNDLAQLPETKVGEEGNG